MSIVFYIAVFIFGITAAFFLTSFFVAGCTRKAKKCTQKGTATLVRVTKADGRDASQWFEIAYTCDGTDYTVMVAQKHAEGISTETPAGTQVPIWYDPKKPERVIIAEDPSMTKTVKSWKRIRKPALILMLIAAGIMVYTFFRAENTPELPLPMMTTIGQFSDEIKAVAEKTPDGFTYTESIDSPETFTVTIDNPDIAKEALDIILDTSVDRVGWQVDMYRLQYEEYCFVFGEETYTFSFIPNSYFCYGGEYHELGENRLVRIRDYLHENYDTSEPEEEEPQSEWYSEDAVLRTHFVDNGDEARSVTELTLSAGGETITGVIEGAYDVLSVEKHPDGYVICYTYGDFYSHEAIHISRVTVENGEMIITDMAQ